jgi:hypothetical protein
MKSSVVALDTDSKTQLPFVCSSYADHLRDSGDLEFYRDAIDELAANLC